MAPGVYVGTDYTDEDETELHRIQGYLGTA